MNIKTLLRNAKVKLNVYKQDMQGMTSDIMNRIKVRDEKIAKQYKNVKQKIIIGFEELSNLRARDSLQIQKQNNMWLNQLEQLIQKIGGIFKKITLMKIRGLETKKQNREKLQKNKEYIIEKIKNSHLFQIEGKQKCEEIIMEFEKAVFISMKEKITGVIESK